MIEPYADVPAPIGFPDPGTTTYPGSGAADEIGDVQVQWAEYGMGDHEFGPIAGSEIHCVGCFEEA